MSESMMLCSECAKPFPTRLQELNDHGAPICPECYQKQQAAKQSEETK